ncbi:putative tail protein [Pectobacterium phage DU_PP_I]|nr:putative tail protein [Pectobacterium phage DU_PP_I]ATS93982.1 putative tail protein [Pectobacterium phage DU_PP_IV]
MFEILNISPSFLRGLIPAMTSENTPVGYFVHQSGFHLDGAGTGYGWQAFDHSPSTNWYSQSSNSPWWLSISFPHTVQVSKYSLSNRTTTAYTNSPKSWLFQGSGDGSVWETIHTVSGSEDNTPGSKREYSLSAVALYQHFRIYVTDKNGAPVDRYISLNAFEIFS